MIRLFSNTATNRNLVKNIFGSYLIKGLGIVCSVISMPLYIRYFHDNTILGVWFTLLSVLNWILVFDMGIGNGLRNHLTISLSQNNTIRSKQLISSAYLLLGGWTLIISLIITIISRFIPWNEVFNVDISVISPIILYKSIIITLLGIVLSFFLRIIGSILYALQKSALNNLLSFASQLLILLYLVLFPPVDNVTDALINMSCVFAISTNIGLLLATIWLFIFGPLKKIRPHISYFKKEVSKDVLSLGIVFLVLQILYMIVSVTDSWFITKFYEPENTVEYQIYYKVFSLVGTIFMLALTPLWSAITKAMAEHQYSWIIKLQNLLYKLFLLLVGLQILFVFMMPYVFKLWLGNNAIPYSYLNGSIFCLYGIIFTWVALQSTIVAGLGRLKIQLICYLLAVLIKVFMIIYLNHFFTNWIFVVLATSVALLPYSIIQPIALRRFFENNIKHNLKF